MNFYPTNNFKILGQKLNHITTNKTVTIEINKTTTIKIVKWETQSSSEVDYSYADEADWTWFTPKDEELAKEKLSEEEYDDLWDFINNITLSV